MSLRANPLVQTLTAIINKWSRDSSSPFLWDCLSILHHCLFRSFYLWTIGDNPQGQYSVGRESDYTERQVQTPGILLSIVGTNLTWIPLLTPGRQSMGGLYTIHEGQRISSFPQVLSIMMLHHTPPLSVLLSEPSLP